MTFIFLQVELSWQGSNFMSIVQFRRCSNNQIHLNKGVEPRDQPLVKMKFSRSLGRGMQYANSHQPIITDWLSVVNTTSSYEEMIKIVTTPTQLNIKLGLTRKWLCTPPPPTENSMSAIFQLLLTKYWHNINPIKCFQILHLNKWM